MLITREQVKRKEKKRKKKGEKRARKFSSVPFFEVVGEWGQAVNASRYDQAVFILESPWNDGFLPFQLIEDGSEIKEGRGAIDEFFTLWLTVFQSVQRNCISSIRVGSCLLRVTAIFHSYSFHLLRRKRYFPFIFFISITNIFLSNLRFPLMTSSFLLICILNAETCCCRV